jgi:hypothetical protein
MLPRYSRGCGSLIVPSTSYNTHVAFFQKHDHRPHICTLQTRLRPKLLSGLVQQRMGVKTALPKYYVRSAVMLHRKGVHKPVEPLVRMHI